MNNGCFFLTKFYTLKTESKTSRKIINKLIQNNLFSFDQIYGLYFYYHNSEIKPEQNLITYELSNRCYRIVRYNQSEYMILIDTLVWDKKKQKIDIKFTLTQNLNKIFYNTYVEIQDWRIHQMGQIFQWGLDVRTETKKYLRKRYKFKQKEVDFFCDILSIMAKLQCGHKLDEMTRLKYHKSNRKFSELTKKKKIKNLIVYADKSDVKKEGDLMIILNDNILRW